MKNFLQLTINIIGKGLGDRFKNQDKVSGRP